MSSLSLTCRLISALRFPGPGLTWDWDVAEQGSAGNDGAPGSAGQTVSVDVLLVI